METRGAIRRRKKSQQTTAEKVVHSSEKGAKSGFPFCKCIGILFGISFIGGALFLWKISLLPSPINASIYYMPERPEFIEKLRENDLLSRAEYMFENELTGPESIVIHNGAVYTGTHDGKILEIKNGKIRTLKASRYTCGSYEMESLCGRPLGMRLLDDETLIYVDSYLGLFTLDMKTGKSKLLVEGGEVVNGHPLSFLDDLVVLNNGTVLFTDASSKFPRRDFMLKFLEHANDGRVLAYDLAGGNLRVVLDKLHFPNGIEKSVNEDYVLITETTEAKIVKLHLRGAKAGKAELFANNLPGLPDNIRRSSDGRHFWLAFASVRRQDRFNFLEMLRLLPRLREFIAKLLTPEQMTKYALQFSPKYGLIALYDEQGEIQYSLHDSAGAKVTEVSQVTDDGAHLYLGSFHAPYLARVALPSDLIRS